MLESILDFLKAVAGLLGMFSNPSPPKVEEILPEKSASEKALEDLKKGA